MESVEHRLHMCEIAASRDGRTKVFDFGIINKLSGEMYHTIKQLMDSELTEEYEFSLIIGMDNANTFDKWYNYKELEKLIRIVVVPHQGEKIDTNISWYLKTPHMFLKPDEENFIPQISSTDIREWLKDVNDRMSFIIQLQKHLDSEILAYIMNNHLSLNTHIILYLHCYKKLMCVF